MNVADAIRSGAARLAGLRRALPRLRRSSLAERASALLPDRRRAEGLPLLRLSGVCKRYSLGPVEMDVLRGVDLDIHAGDVLSIMGGSGSGKSTLLNIMGLLDRPTDGSVEIAGRNASAMNDDELSDMRNRSIGFVFQSFRLLPRMTAWENVALPLAYRGLEGPPVRERAEKMLERVAMGDRAEHRPDQLSGGQQQRVAIARALVASPAILLADEPTGALDPNTGREIMRLFVELNAARDIAVVVITHDPLVARQCVRNARLVDGAIRETADPAITPGNAGMP